MQGEDPNALQVTGLAPDAVVQGASAVEVRILGVNFKSGAQVSFSGTGITVTGVVFVSSGELRATVNIAASAPPGACDLTITNPGGQTLTRPGLFHVSASLGTVVLQWDGPMTGSQHGPPLNLRAAFTKPPSGSGSVPGQQAETRGSPGARGEKRGVGTVDQRRPCRTSW